MKITNHTKVKTPAVRQLIVAVAKRGGFTEAAYLKGLFVTLKPGNRHHGLATLALNGIMPVGGFAFRKFGRNMTLWFPEDSRLNAPMLAAVIHHEMAHNWGQRHPAMTDDIKYCEPLKEFQDWTFPRQMPKVKALKAAADPAKRLHAVEANLKRARTRAKRAKTILLKWERKYARLARVLVTEKLASFNRKAGE